MKANDKVWARLSTYPGIWVRGTIIRIYGNMVAVNVCGSHTNLEVDKKNIEAEKEETE